MSNIENIKILADVAHQSGNYEQSYGYYSRILEEEIDNDLAWLRKGIAAANLTTSNKEMITEAKTLIERSLKIGIADHERQDGAYRLRSAYESLTKKLNDELLSEVKDYQKVGMPAGGSALIHMAGQSANQLLVAGGQAAVRCKSLDLLEIMCELENNSSTYEYAVRAIEALKAHSKAAGNYLTQGATNIYGPRVDRLLDQMQTQLWKDPAHAPRLTTLPDSVGNVANPTTKKSGVYLSDIFPYIFVLGILLIVILGYVSK